MVWTLHADFEFERSGHSQGYHVYDDERKRLMRGRAARMTLGVDVVREHGP